MKKYCFEINNIWQKTAFSVDHFHNQSLCVYHAYCASIARLNYVSLTLKYLMYYWGRLRFRNLLGRKKKSIKWPDISNNHFFAKHVVLYSRYSEATAALFSLERKQALSPQGRLVVKLDLQEILQVYLCYIVHNVPGGETVKENKDNADNTGGYKGR